MILRFTRGLDKALQAEEDQEEEECPESLQVIVNYICYMNMTKIIFLLQDQCCLLLCLAWAVDKLPCCHRYVETLDNSTKIPMVWNRNFSIICEKGTEKKRFDFNLSCSPDVVVCQKSLIHSTAHCSTAADSWQLDLWLQTRFTLIPTISAHAVNFSL